MAIGKNSLWGMVILLGLYGMGGVSALAEEGNGKEEEKGWISLFNGKDLDGWKIPQFGGEGEVTVENGCMKIGMGVMISGAVYTKTFPKNNYELQWEANRTLGNDFFGSLTFPIGEEFATFITGGWGGGVFGISCIDGMDASENDTMQLIATKSEKWYTFRVRVTDDKVECFVDGKKIIDRSRDGATFKTRFEVEYSEPLGILTYCCEALIKNIRYRNL